MQRWIRSALVLLVSLALAAQAQPEGKRPRPEGQRQHPEGGKVDMPEPDLNGDGVVDDAEAAQYGKTRLEQVKKSLDTMVKRFDANGDGNLDDEEQARMKNQLAEHGGGRDPMAMLKRFDKDGDFQIGRAHV